MSNLWPSILFGHSKSKKSNIVGNKSTVLILFSLTFLLNIKGTVIWSLFNEPCDDLCSGNSKLLLKSKPVCALTMISPERTDLNIWTI